MNCNYFNRVRGGQFENLCVARVFLMMSSQGRVSLPSFHQAATFVFLRPAFKYRAKSHKKTEEFSANPNF